MSIQLVRDYLQKHAPYLGVTELKKSTGTVEQAAEAFGVESGQIAKTLSFYVNEKVVLLVMAGDRRLDNRKYKTFFGVKARMVPSEEVELRTGFAPGAVSPLGVHSSVTVYCDESLKNFQEVIPSGGNDRSGVWIAPVHLANLTGAVWVDLCTES